MGVFFACLGAFPLVWAGVTLPVGDRVLPLAHPISAWPHRRSCRTAQMFRRSSDSVPLFVRPGGYGRHHPT